MWRCCIRLCTGFMIMSHCTGVNREQPTEKRCGPRARPGPETSKSLWFGHDQEIVCGASAVCTCIFNLCWPAGRGMRCLPGWLCCGKGVVASAPRAPQAGPPFRLFARMSSFPAAHTAGDYRHCRVNLSSGLAKSTLSRSLCYNTTDRNDHTPRAPSSPPTYNHCPQQERRGLSAKNHVNLRIISIADTQQSASALLLRGRKVRSTRISSCPHECGGHKHATTAHECLTRTQEVHAMLVDRQ